MTGHGARSLQRLARQHAAAISQMPCVHLLSNARGDAAALHCALGALRQPPFEPPQCH